MGFMDLILAINKPVGPTSHDIVQQVRRLTGERRVGHAGTLDPLASGVLVIGIGKATKQLNQHQQTEKEYEARIRLGSVSTTDDNEGSKMTCLVLKPPSLNLIGNIVKEFTGDIWQKPPLYSALKVGGRSAYKYARAKQKVDLPPRKVVIHQIEVVAYEWPDLEIRVVTGPGVYIRSLAKDIGFKLEVGGYLAGLIRTRVGQWTLAKTTSEADLAGRLKQVGV
jgi:tRNA pseudouridine55 synthase